MVSGLRIAVVIEMEAAKEEPLLLCLESVELTTLNQLHMPELEVLRGVMEHRTKELAREQAAMQKEQMHKMGVKP
jgi:hypothetical protein